ncbi:hypothetical protein LR48_Vigan10g121400 [Vigna angularis]|uniref:Uncharacterized protein n=1 Tax=Phaseolus angularis TaxID=3914 RepID=A0A0L9VK77_PHAAN|nr:hypothetical protein LR48_Vigan10g121400 [Vigna angularis]
MVQGAQTRSGSWQLRVEGMVSEPSLSQYGVVRGRTRAKAGGHVTPGHGDEWQLRVEGVHGRIEHTPE